MDKYTEATRNWLEERYQRGVAEGYYQAHRPIYGFGVKPSEPSHTARMALALAILRQLNTLKGRYLLDLGGGEGYIAALARDLLGYESLVFDLAESACQRARELFGLPALSGDAHHLPFADKSVDIVVLSEVIEHLTDPIRTLTEAWRVSRVSLIVTTQECCYWKWQRIALMGLRNLKKKHSERNYFHPLDFQAVFGKEIDLINPCLLVPLVSESRISRKEAQALIPYLAQVRPFGPGSYGVMVVVKKQADAMRSSKTPDTELVNKLFSFSVPLPNISRVDESAWPRWVRECQTASINAEREPVLSANWSESDRKHIEYFRSMLTCPAVRNPIIRFSAKSVLIIFTLFRILLAPGGWRLKFRWFIRSIDRRKIKKCFGG